MQISPAAENDLNALRTNSKMLTPVKLKKEKGIELRQFNEAADDLFSTAVPGIRQSIEGFFHWQIEKTDIQRASKVHSEKGLILHVFGKIAAALVSWVF